MTKSELVQRISSVNPDLYERGIEKIINTMLDEIAEALSKGVRVELRGFGAFSVRTRRPRIGRNPRTGEHVNVAAKTVPHFKTGKDMRERVNGSTDDKPR